MAEPSRVKAGKERKAIGTARMPPAKAMPGRSASPAEGAKRGRGGPQGAGGDRVERGTLHHEMRREAGDRPAPEPDEQGEIDRRDRGERGSDQGGERAAKGEIEQDRAAADQVDGKEEGGDEIERAVALACGMLLLLVLEPPEIARQQQPDGRAPLGSGQSGIAIPAAATHGRALPYPP